MSWIAVGIGAAVGAAGGAAIGSKKGGDDVWKGALLGGVLGAAGGGIGGAAFGGAGAAAEGAAGAGLAEGAAGAGLGAEAGSGLALGGAGLETGGAMGLGGAGATEAGIGGSAAFGSGAGFGSTAPAALPGSTAAFGTTGGATVGEVGGAASGASSAGGSGAGGWWGGLSNAQKAGVISAGTMGLGALMQNGNSSAPTPEEYNGPLSKFKYDPGNYTPTYAQPNVYKPRYAEGGIACLAAGGQTNPMDPIQNPIYPQSQQDHTNFATSTQYPNSIKSAMAADYDARTNPMTGAELPMGMADGGWVNTINSMHPGGALGDWHGQVYGTIADATGFNPGGVGGALMPGNYEYNKKLAEEEEKKRREAEGNSMADGGIASLGGYSDGGQLLKGPGDGVSDSIPASIGRRQPARLADGEFVIPSRAVSELGNGSTDAGAKQLYAMLDRIDKKRKKGKGLAYQANPKKMLPA